MKIAGTSIKGFRLDKNGKLVPNTKRLSVSKQIAQRKSKKVSVKRKQLKPNEGMS